MNIMNINEYSGKEYKHVLKVWNKFGIKAVKDYHNSYLKCHVLLLTDVFKEFRNNIRKNYGLCLSHYLSAPALSWDAILNMTKIKLEFISDSDIYIFFEKGMRGEVSYLSSRYSKVNNKYLKSYDQKQEL